MADFNSRLNPRLGKRERLAVGAGVGQFTEANYIIAQTEKRERSHATGAIIQNTGTTNVLYTLDGTSPTAAIGFILIPNAFITLHTAQQIKNFKATRATTDTSVEALFEFGN